MTTHTSIVHMSDNEILKRVYDLYPAIGAWFRSGKVSPLWDSPYRAQLAMAEYVGNNASALFMDSHHIVEGARTFLRDSMTLVVVRKAVSALYDNKLVNGLLPERAHAPA
jgi:hypothetical protein